MRIKVLTLGLVCLFFMYCATAPKPREIVKSFPVEKPFDKVWTAVIESFAELNLPILNMEKDSGLITTDWIDFTGQIGKEYADCGKDIFASEISREGRLNVFVKKIADISCEITVNCMFQQTAKSTLSNEISKGRCVSTGKLEAELYELIQSKTI